MHAHTKILTAIAATLALTAAATADARQGSFKARGPNGVVAGKTGPNGTVVRGRGRVQNADGSVTQRSGGAFQGTNGSSGKRASSTTVSPDGSVSRSGEAYVSGTNGSASSAGAFQRDADGNWSGSRSTTATNNNTGNSYSGSTAINPATGKPVHSGTCTDASGAVIPCR